MPSLDWDISEEAVEGMGRDVRENLRKWMILYWGERCPDVEESCLCCRAWKAFDTIFENLDGE